MYGHVCYASCSRMRTRHMGLAASRKTLRGRRCPQTPHKRGTLGCDKGHGREGVRLEAHEPLDGCARRTKKGHNSIWYLFLFIFRKKVHKEVWVEVLRGMKHPPVVLEVLIGVRR